MYRRIFNLQTNVKLKLGGRDFFFQLEKKQFKKHQKKFGVLYILIKRFFSPLSWVMMDIFAYNSATFLFETFIKIFLLNIFSLGNDGMPGINIAQNAFQKLY